MSFCYKSDLRCASPSAHESGIFCLLFFAVKKKSVAEGIKGNPRGGMIRTKKNQIGITSRLSLFAFPGVEGD